MCQPYRSPFRIGILASSALLLLVGVARSQTVTMFDDAPSVEQLRNIMIPVSPPGTGRTIVIQRPGTGTSSVQPAATQVVSAPKVPVAAKTLSDPSITPAATTEAAEPSPEAPKPAPSFEPATVAFHIGFAFNSAAMPVSARGMVDRMATLMQQTPELKVRVEGHTDAVGSVGYNISLSQRRAMAVAEYLVERGVDASRVLPVGKGMSEPWTVNPYDAANRRVQFVSVE